MTEIPIYNTNSNCAIASTGISMTRNTTKYCSADFILVVGFEKMFSGGLKGFWDGTSSPIEGSMEIMTSTKGVTESSFVVQMFANTARDYIERLVEIPSGQLT
jgi:sterol carrier protein 2